MAEWLKAHAWKACIGETLSRVRIPVSPPFKLTVYSNVTGAKYRELRLFNVMLGSMRPKLGLPNGLWSNEIEKGRQIITAARRGL